MHYILSGVALSILLSIFRSHNENGKTGALKHLSKAFDSGYTDTWRHIELIYTFRPYALVRWFLTFSHSLRLPCPMKTEAGISRGLRIAKSRTKDEQISYRRENLVRDTPFAKPCFAIGTQITSNQNGQKFSPANCGIEYASSKPIVAHPPVNLVRR